MLITAIADDETWFGRLKACDWVTELLLLLSLLPLLLWVSLALLLLPLKVGYLGSRYGFNTCYKPHADKAVSSERCAGFGRLAAGNHSGGQQTP